jgi:antitoxin component YwqK of YwqJK toxin-antitoxin module
MRILFSIYIIFFFSPFGYTQDIKKVIKKEKDSEITEEFFVLKSDKSIKNGNYVKYCTKIAVQKYLQELGNYDYNKKSGSWLTFSSFHPLNPLTLIGEYSAGLKTGEWSFLHIDEMRDTTALFQLGFERQNVLSSSNKELQVSIDTTGLKVAVYGTYDKDKKTGLWKYYSKQGKLIKAYDFSNNKEIYRFDNDSSNFYLLGGFSHFQDLFYQTLQENSSKLKILPTSEAKFKIKTNDGNLQLEYLSPDSLINNSLAELVKNSVLRMPKYWIDFDPALENFSFILDLKLIKEKNSYKIKYQAISPRF